ncbi:MAG: VCBS repeat-containing protein [Deltaproteobacteria bacterium]
MRRMVLATLALFGCSELEPLELDTCGNGVWEPMAGEDCDTNTDEGQCGRPGTIGACQYICSTSADCPGGRQCGADRICRLPIRQFRAPPGSPYATVGNQLAVADLDGDTHFDLVGTNARGANVLFGDGEGAFFDRRSLTTGAPLSRAMRAAVTAPNPQRLVTPMGAGVQVHGVDAQRNLSAVANAALPFDLGDRVRLVRLPSNGLQDLLAVFLEVGRTVALTTFGLPSRPTTIDESLADLRTPVAGDLDGDRVAELAVAFAGASDVQVLELRCEDGGPVSTCTERLQWRTAVTVAFGAPVERLAFADFDADGDLDLFAATTEDIRVARGRGDLTFAPPVVDARVDCDGDCAVLLVEDLDGDGRADYVFDAALVTTSSAAAQARHEATSGELDEWSYAATGDFDGDGRRDVAVALEGEFGIEVAYGATTPLYNTFFEDTAQPIAGLVAADFDGDGIDDLAAVLLSLEGSTVVVLYGGTAGFSAPVPMGRFAGVRGLLPVFLAGPPPQSVDFRADLIVETNDPASSGDRIVVLIATQEHQMVSPLLLSPTPVNPIPALAVATGTFLAEAGDEDLLIVTSDKVVRVPTNAAGAFDLQLAVTQDQSSVDGTTSRRLVETAQLDDDAFTEVIVATGTHPKPDDEGRSVVVFDPDSEDDVSIVELSLPEVIYSPTSVRVAALPPIADRVLVLGFVGAGEAPGGVALFSIAEDGTVADAPTVLMAEEGRQVLSVEVANIDSDALPELIVLTETDVYSIEIRDGTLVWGPPIALGETVRPPSAFATMRATDLDRDGLVDLTIASELGLYVYRGVDRLEVTP